MHSTQRLVILFFLPLLVLWGASTSGAEPVSGKPPVTNKVKSILKRATPLLEKELSTKELSLGAPVFIRIFKLSSQLEIWLNKDGRYELFKTYSICDFSGFPGPKKHEGDWQSPEGFYSVTADQMNPRSSYHLSFDIGYPNEYDRRLHRDGGNIMVHGSCSSMGCFAMGDFRIEEIYTLVHTALTKGQEKIDAHIFPFRMTEENMQKFHASPWIAFWKNLKEGYDEFEKNRVVPKIQVANGRYVVQGSSKVALLKASN